MQNEVRLLSEPENFAVVHIPGRRFPGVVFQGDSLNILIKELEEALETDDAGAREDQLSFVIQMLRGIQQKYEGTLEREKIPLPYTR